MKDSDFTPQGDTPYRDPADDSLIVFSRVNLRVVGPVAAGDPLVAGDATGNVARAGKPGDGFAPARHAHAQSDVTGLAAALAGKASTADATLTAVYGEWACVPSTYQDAVIIVRGDFEESSWVLFTQYGGPPIGAIAKYMERDGGTVLIFRAGEDWFGDVDLVATRSKSYTLGSQSTKPLAPARNYALKSELPNVPVKAVQRNGTALLPDENGAVNVEVPTVVAPSTADGDAGKAADAKATGEALALKANASAMPASETWTFTVDDGQGGTTTVTKRVAVYAAQTQGAGA